MTISQSNLFSGPFNAIKTFLTDNITDPAGRYKQNIVHASRPHINSKGFSGYPYFILTVDVSEETISHDGVTSNKIFRAVIDVVSDQSVEVDTVSDEIMSKLKDETLLTDFKARDLSASPFTWDLDDKGKKIHTRSIGFRGRTRI